MRACVWQPEKSTQNPSEILYINNRKISTAYMYAAKLAVMLPQGSGLTRILLQTSVLRVSTGGPDNCGVQLCGSKSTCSARSTALRKAKVTLLFLRCSSPA
ncbi:unnamed protein product [Ectocarpus sp. 4 AP-2014]